MRACLTEKGADRNPGRLLRAPSRFCAKKGWPPLPKPAGTPMKV
jgi:hypothetical protein